MIAIVDYGLGNVHAFTNIYKRLNIAVKVAQRPEDLDDADKIILPGVGSFDWAMTRLEVSGMREKLDNLVVSQLRPVLGVCVGMQMLAKRSDEGDLLGLGWIDAEVKRFSSTHFLSKTHLPHMGWNDVTPVQGGIFAGIESPLFYFLHSYYFEPGNQDQVIGITDYNGLFASAVSNGNIYGVQFHPEKSHQCGVQLLKNFAEL
jgi:imidazole glycerol-phosphate synthase subunit HisH